MTYKAWEETLTAIIGSDEFRSQIQNRSYFLSPEYISFKKYIQSEFNMIATTNTANFLSKDFWHQQSRTLRDSGYYLIRTGRGSFAIMAESKFPRPYLQLNIENAIELRSSDNPYSNNLEQAFYSNKQENAALEQLRFTGIYDIVLKELFGSDHKYHR